MANCTDTTCRATEVCCVSDSDNILFDRLFCCSEGFECGSGNDCNAPHDGKARAFDVAIIFLGVMVGLLILMCILVYVRKTCCKTNKEKEREAARKGGAGMPASYASAEGESMEVPESHARPDRPATAPRSNPTDERVQVQHSGLQLNDSDHHDSRHAVGDRPSTASHEPRGGIRESTVPEEDV